LSRATAAATALYGKQTIWPPALHSLADCQLPVVIHECRYCGPIVGSCRFVVAI